MFKMTQGAFYSVDARITCQAAINFSRVQAALAGLVEGSEAAGFKVTGLI
ncbi:MAG: hypothetical protein IJ106_08285 [Parasporobacterium sp.]|nr:hypothetical protein [Parasporobacterium sp.]